MSIKSKVNKAFLIVGALLGAVFIFMTAHVVTIKVKGDKYRSEVAGAVKESEISVSLALAVIMAESGFQEYAVSDKGAVGLMQVLPETAKYVKEYYGISEGSLYSEEYNIKVGCLYLIYLYEKFKNIKYALVAYNAGEGNVASWIEKGEIEENKRGVCCPFKESERYVARVMRFEKEFKLLRF